MLPIVVRSAEEMLRLVPDELREASYALGVPKWKTIIRIVLPTALSGILSGTFLALARIIGETAPVLVLVGYSRSINYDILHDNMASLPLLIYSELANPEAAAIPGCGGGTDIDHRGSAQRRDGRGGNPAHLGPPAMTRPPAGPL